MLSFCLLILECLDRKFVINLKTRKVLVLQFLKMVFCSEDFSLFYLSLSFFTIGGFSLFITALYSVVSGQCKGSTDSVLHFDAFSQRIIIINIYSPF